MADQPKEIEFKFQLSPENFEKLLKRLKDQKQTTKVQENFYFDTADLALKKSGATFRIRRKDEDLWLTLKVSEKLGKFSLAAVDLQLQDSARLSSNFEFEIKVSPSDLDLDRLLKDRSFVTDLMHLPQSPGTVHPIEVLIELLEGKLSRDFNDLLFIGGNRTERHSIQMLIAGKPFELEVDKTWFPNDFIGYELEVEIPKSLAGYQEMVESEIGRLLKSVKIPIIGSPYGKASVTFMILMGTKETIKELKKSNVIY